ncbi:MAG TPA: NAD(P)-dependent oxidoreductase, partial [Steroidobacteraceae bacterium]|nr:NAD(P)-dependent oxidoreductase [Steroidobacteraceae bacterium]
MRRDRSRRSDGRPFTVVEPVDMRVGIIGLGSMGAPIARRLLAAGHSVRGYNRTRSRADALASDGLIPVDSPAAAASDIDVLITMVSDDTALEEVLFAGESGAVTDGVHGLVHVGMSTISDALADRLEAVHGRAGQSYVSAPVFGPPEGARNGKLFIAAAGAPDAIARVRPVLDVLGRVDVIGERPAAANIVKLAGNFLMASAVEGLRESIALVDAAGANPSQFIGLITQAL